MTVKCKFCGRQSKTKKVKGYLNWKCEYCGEINPFKTPTPVIWKCDTGTYQKCK